MTTIAYLECPTGLAGDMCLGALIHAGVPLNYLAEQLAKLGIADEYTLEAETVHRNGIAATKLHVRLASASAQAQEDAALIAEGELPGQSPAADTIYHHTSTAFSTTSASATATSNGQTVTHAHHAHHGSHPHADHAHAHHDHHAHHAHAHAHASTHPPTPPHVHPPYHHDHEPTRKLPDIEALIQSADLPPRATAWSLAVFRQLAIAEAAVHGTTPEAVHFHEVGATDAIVDIVGTALGLDWLGIDALYCAPMPTGGGVVHAAHGTMPVPTPAVLKLWELRQVPVYSNGIHRELVTPTGAALATAIATDFGDPPPMTIERVGLGAGSRQLPIPNMVRLWLGKPAAPTPRSRSITVTQPITAQSTQNPTPTASESSASASAPSPNAPNSIATAVTSPPTSATWADPNTPTTVTVLETQVDDLSPQVIGYLFDRLFEAGAVDVFTQAITMKKSRPGQLITVICPGDRRATCEQVLLTETTTLGIRWTEQQRTILPRQFTEVTTPYGTITVKLAYSIDGRECLKAHPEFDDCAQAAIAHGVPLRTVQQAALVGLNSVLDVFINR